MRSLRGKNNSRRASGASSSLAASSIFYKLRDLDRQIAYWESRKRYAPLYGELNKVNKKINILDQKRKEVRIKRKERKV